MHRTDAPNFDNSTIPGKRIYKETPTPRSTFGYRGANAIQEELCGYIESRGITVRSSGADDEAANYTGQLEAAANDHHSATLASANSYTDSKTSGIENSINYLDAAVTGFDNDNNIRGSLRSGLACYSYAPDDSKFVVNGGAIMASNNNYEVERLILSISLIPTVINPTATDWQPRGSGGIMATGADSCADGTIIHIFISSHDGVTSQIVVDTDILGTNAKAMIASEESVSADVIYMVRLCTTFVEDISSRLTVRGFWQNPSNFKEIHWVANDIPDTGAGLSYSLTQNGSWNSVERKDDRYDLVAGLYTPEVLIFGEINFRVFDVGPGIEAVLVGCQGSSVLQNNGPAQYKRLDRTAGDRATMNFRVTNKRLGGATNTDLLKIVLYGDCSIEYGFRVHGYIDPLL